MSLSAREAWDAERVWKGKSAVYDQEGGSTNIPTTAAIYDPRSSVYSTQGAAYIFPQGQYRLTPQGSFYAIPVTATNGSTPVQAVYATPANYPYNNSGYDPIESPLNSYRPLSNPLPDPPRQSTYSPEPLVPRQTGVEDPLMTPEYWKVYAGIASH